MNKNKPLAAATHILVLDHKHPVYNIYTIPQLAKHLFALNYCFNILGIKEPFRLILN